MPKAKRVTRDDVQKAASDALRALGSAVGLVFAIEDVALDSKKKKVTVTLCLQLPRTADLEELGAHPLSKEVVAAVTKSAEPLGYSGEATFVLEPLDEDPIGHLIPIVRRCPTPERVVAFLESFRG